MIWYFIALIVLIALSAFCSASEMAYSSANPLRLENLMEDGSARAKIAHYITEHFDHALSAILIGNNLVNIGASSLAAVTVMLLTGTDKWSWLATVILTIAVIIFGETIPKILAKQNANAVSLRHAYAVRFMMIVLAPVVLLVVGLVKLLTLPLKGEPEAEDEEEAAQELQSILETAEDEDVLDEDRSELVQAALEFSDVAASDAMTARVDMTAIDIDDDWDEIRALLDTTPYSRLPVYEDSVDNIIGVLYLNRFFRGVLEEVIRTGSVQPPKDLRAALMEPCFVYKTTKLPVVLEQLRKEKKHLAIVTDEYGGTLGIITMEDVLEQIVGEIWDETDVVEPEEVISVSDGIYNIDGDMIMDDFLELLGRDEDEFETDSATVGGWTLERFGAFPKAGESFEFENLKVTVLKMDGMRVERVRVEVKE